MDIETPKEAVERCIRIFRSVHKSEDSWRNVIHGRDVDNFCTKAEVFENSSTSNIFVLCISTSTDTHEPMDMVQVLSGGMWLIN